MVESRIGGIGLETSYEEEVDMYVDKKRPRRLDSGRLKDIGKGLIKDE